MAMQNFNGIYRRSASRLARSRIEKRRAQRDALAQDLLKRNSVIYLSNAGSIGVAGTVQEPKQLIREAVAAHQSGDFNRAWLLYQTALQRAPDNAHVWQLAGVLLLQAGQPAAAVERLERAVTLDPRHADARSNLGLAYEALGRIDEAYAQFAAAVELNPYHGQALTNLGNLARKRGDLDKAIQAYRRALNVAPDQIEARNNLAASLRERGELDAAMVEIRQVLATVPRNVDALTNLGTIQLAQGDYASALDSLELALREQPSSAMTRHNRVLALLSLGRLREAWNNYDAGFVVGERFYRDFGAASYAGEPLAGKTLLIYAEQGVGDEVFFAGWIPFFAERAQRVIVDCDTRLAPLFERSFPHIQVHGGSKHDPVDWIHDLGTVDYQIPMGNLPRFASECAHQGRALGSYLHAAPQPLRNWTKRLTELGPGLRVGLSWRGGATPYARATRSIPLPEWAAILRTPDVNFVSVQYGTTPQELSEAAALASRPVHYWSEAESLNDLENFAALLRSLDVVISVDNSTVHLAGALGVPVFCLIPHVPDWRWETQFHGTTWYPSVRLFRQERSNAWHSTLDAVHNNLAELAQR